MPTRKITEIIIHCAATRASQGIGVQEIRRWHTAPRPKGRGWDDIGYHYVIRRDGTLESGRPLDKAGFHCAGRNANTVGICLAGGVAEDGVTPECNYTPEQWHTLARTVYDLLKRYPGATVHGHNEFAAKACPCFDVRVWWSDVRGIW